MSSQRTGAWPVVTPRLPALGDIAFGQFALLIGVLAVSVSSFAISPITGILVTLAFATLTVALAPALAPAFVVIGFLYQNTVAAFFMPMITSETAFTVIRSTNFIAVVVAFAVLVTSAYVGWRHVPKRLWPHIGIVAGLCGVIGLYFIIGAVRGTPMDAIIYFRNTITPVCTFAIGLIAAMLYGARINRLLLIIGAIALFYGYCEFFFQLDFLALFHGDDYTAMRFVDRLETRQLVNSLQDPGVRYPGLQELMTVPLFNLTVLDDYLPRVFRLSGPNFHPISYAYAIAIIASWFVMQRRWAFLIIALPLLFVVGSKGATVIVLATVFFRGALFFLRPRAAIASLVGILVLYITAAIVIGHVKADYHVLGFFAGIRDFIGNPLGQGLGIGGNLSSSLDGVHDWQEAQHQGIANIPLESAVGVMLYQMGPGALAYFAWLIAIVRKSAKIGRTTKALLPYFAATVVPTIMANAVLQEEAIYSPLALGLALLLVGTTMGHWLRDGGVSEAHDKRSPLYHPRSVQRRKESSLA